MDKHSDNKMIDTIEKLTPEELKKAAGGNMDDVEIYMNELFQKYGITDEDVDALINVMTEEEKDRVWEEANKP